MLREITNLSSIVLSFLISSTLLSCANGAAEVSEKVISSKRTETTLQTEPPLIVADVLRIGDAEVVASEAVGQAYLTRENVGHVEIKAGAKLLRGDLIELMPKSRLVLKIAGHSRELVSSEKGAWYKLD